MVSICMAPASLGCSARKKKLDFDLPVIFQNSFNPLPQVKILDLSKLKAFADDKINVT